MTLQDILLHITQYSCDYVCLTGGEPLLQDESLQLIDLLHKKGYQISVETNGSINIKNIAQKKHVMISLDIKCPSSNMQDKMYLQNISYLRASDQLKFIMSTKADYEHAKQIILRYKPPCTMYFQPVWGSNLASLAQWILDDGLNIRLGLQLQKILWGESKGK
jgi:7-carboxy-7-deazaguanine synthase